MSIRTFSPVADSLLDRYFGALLTVQSPAQRDRLWRLIGAVVELSPKHPHQTHTSAR